MKKYIFLLSVLLFVTSGLFAQSTKTPGIKHKQVNQSKKILQGVKSGSLTKKETANLINQEVKLQKHKKRAKADGMVTPRERYKLNKDANSLNRKIYIKKHNKRKRK